MSVPVTPLATASAIRIFDKDASYLAYTVELTPAQGKRLAAKLRKEAAKVVGRYWQGEHLGDSFVFHSQRNHDDAYFVLDIPKAGGVWRLSGRGYNVAADELDFSNKYPTFDSYSAKSTLERDASLSKATR